MKYAVLGAGVSGLSCARLLHDRGCEVVVFEKESTVGGLARTRFVNGYLYDPYGGHIFNSKNKKVLDFIFSIYSKENWKYTVRNAQILFDGRFVHYPFELSLYDLPTDIANECADEFYKADDIRKSTPEPTNYKDWLYWMFGRGIADYYLIPYNEKIWRFPLDKIETGWMRDKMPLPTKSQVANALIAKDPAETNMVHSSFHYPLRGGIQAMVDALAEGIDVRLGSEVRKIRESNNKKWVINGEGDFDRVISTIPLPELLSIIDLPDSVRKHIEGLKFNSLNTVLFKFPKNTNITWLYIPSKKYKAHRVGYQSALTPYASPILGEGVGALEIIGDKISIDSDYLQHDVLPSQLGFKEALDSEWCKYAYVIHDMYYRENVDYILEYFDKNPSFFLLGRWGTWNYKNMDLCMLDAMELVEKIEK